jgi:NADH-quinone oxidoreductase subunit H
VISAIAEVNRTPFDLPEAEQEIVAGYLTEYSGHQVGALPDGGVRQHDDRRGVHQHALPGRLPRPGLPGRWIPGISEWPIVWLVAKMAIFMFLFIWLRATLPRLRYDQLMRFGWLYLFEVALGAALLTGAVIAFVL